MHKPVSIQEKNAKFSEFWDKNGSPNLGQKSDLILINKKKRTCQLGDFTTASIGRMSQVLTNDLGDKGSILRWVIPKTQKMVLDATLLNTQHYKARIKGKVEQPRERSSLFPYMSVL